MENEYRELIKKLRYTRVCFDDIAEAADAIEKLLGELSKTRWISVEDEKPTGFDVVDESTWQIEPAEYIVHVYGAELSTVGMFDGKKFVKSVYEDAGGFANEIDYWMPLPLPTTKRG